MAARAGAALLAALLVLAGCSGLAGDDRTRPTPAPVPTDAPETASQRSLAPGVGPAGRTDPLALSLAHDRTVRNRSVTVRFERVRRYPNGSLHSRRARLVRASANRTRLFSRFENDGPGATYFPEGGSVTVFTDGTRLLQRTRRGERVSYGGLPPSRYRVGTAPVIPYLPGGGRVYVVFASVQTRFAGVETAGGVERYRVESVRQTGPAGLAGSEQIDAVRNLSVTATITPAGLVRSYRLEYVGIENGTPLTVTTVVSYRAVGSTRVERPPWYGRAMAALDRRNGTNGAGARGDSASP